MGKLILANERIFHTLQGEGKYMGYPCTFVRLSLCNLRCEWKNKDGSSTRCDTPYTSFEPEKNDVEIDQIIKEVSDKNYHVVVSGGEPFFQANVSELIKELRLNNKYVTVETNGTIYRENQADFISLSPKLKSSSSNPERGQIHDKQRINLGALSKFIVNHDYQFKFVVNNEEEVEEILDIKRELWQLTGIDISEKIWLMPQGVSKEQFDEKAEWIWDICKKHHWKYTDRLHIRVYGQRVGV